MWSLLTGLLMLAVAVRLVGLAADLPFMHHPDEPVNLQIIDGMISRSDPNPRFFKYPSLFLYLHAGLHLHGPLLGRIPGLAEHVPITQVMGVSYAPTAGAVLLHRWVTVVLGTGVVLVSALTARRVTTGLLPLTVTGLLLALSPTLITYSRLITPDVPAALLVAVAVYAAVRVQQSGSWWAYAAAGFAVGLAASTKYNAVLVAAPVIVAGLLGTRAALGLPLAGATAVVGFLATTPYAVLDHTEFLKGLQFERRHYASGHSGMEGGAVAYYAWHLVTWEGLLVLLADSWVDHRTATVAAHAGFHLLPAGIWSGGSDAGRPQRPDNPVDPPDARGPRWARRSTSCAVGTHVSSRRPGCLRHVLDYRGSGPVSRGSQYPALVGAKHMDIARSASLVGSDHLDAGTKVVECERPWVANCRRVLWPVA